MSSEIHWTNNIPARKQAVLVLCCQWEENRRKMIKVCYENSKFAAEISRNEILFLPQALMRDLWANKNLLPYMIRKLDPNLEKISFKIQFFSAKKFRTTFNCQRATSAHSSFKPLQTIRRWWIALRATRQKLNAHNKHVHKIVPYHFVTHTDEHTPELMKLKRNCRER